MSSPLNENPTNSETVIVSHNLFSALDAPFIGFNKNEEPIVWQGHGILVQQLFDVKIPSLAGAIIKYTFSTEIGDIYYCIQYLTPGLPEDVIVQPTRVPSNVEAINGTFKCTRNGTFVIIFDNNFSWFNPKLLTYKISLYQVD